MAKKFQSGLLTPSVALTDAAPIAVDASKGNYFRFTFVSSSRTMANPTNPQDGQLIMFEIIQNSGSNTITWDTKYTFSTDIPSPTLTVTAGKRDFLGFIYNSTADLWYCLAVTKGF